MDFGRELIEFITKNEEETQALGEKLASYLQPGDSIGLSGELGTGKTTLIKGICRGLEVKEDVTSPSFVLIHEYNGKFPVYHFDLYRIEREDLKEIGYEEYLSKGGIILVEWVEKIKDLFSSNYLHIHLLFSEELENLNVRKIEFLPFDSRFEKILKEIKNLEC